MRRWINLDFSAGRAHVQVDNGLAKGASQSFTESESISETSAFPVQNEQIAKYWGKTNLIFMGIQFKYKYKWMYKFSSMECY